jgi:hypothetical protein
VQAPAVGSARELLAKIGNVIGNGQYRYVWRGHGSIDWALHTSLHRRTVLSKEQLTAHSVAEAEKKLLRSARVAGYDRFGGRELSNVELLALLQHEGAATQFLDVTPDPFIGLFFACERAFYSDESAALIALLVADDQVVKDVHTSKDEPVDGVLSDVLAASGRKQSPYYLWQPPPLNERIKAQRGMFVIGEITSDQDELSYSTIRLGLVDKGREKTRVAKLLSPSVGKYIKDGPPRIVVFRLSPTLRREML